MRCHYCGSYAIEQRGDEVACRDCDVIGPARLFTTARNDTHLDKVSLAYAGICVACQGGPPNPHVAFAQTVAAEMRAIGRRWPAGEGALLSAP